MTQEVIERTVRDWVYSNPVRAARDLDRLSGPRFALDQKSAEEIAAAFIQLVSDKNRRRAR